MSVPFFASGDMHQDFNQPPPGFGNEPVPISTYRNTEPIPISTYRYTELIQANSNREKGNFWVNDHNIERATEHNINKNSSFQDNNNDRSSFTPGKTDLNQLPPIPPVSTGHGLPYAPVDWPNPGDVWSWRVGKRVGNAGFHLDRFLILPPRLWKRSVSKSFGSKTSITCYIQAEFPGTDINAFFASFCWKIPALFQPSPKVDAASLFEETTTEQHKEETERDKNAQKDGKEETPQYTQKKRKPIRTQTDEPVEKKPKATPLTAQMKRKGKSTTTPATAPPPTSKQKSQQSFRKHGGFVDLNFLNNETETGQSACSSIKKLASDFEDDQVCMPHIYVSPINGVLAVSHPPVDINPDEFDDYLNSLDNLLSWPTEDEHEQVSTFPIGDYELAEARMKLSSLLVKDLPSLFFSNNVTELANLATKLRKDPRLSLEEMVRLKLIEEIPLFSEVFKENREAMEEADKFFSTLELNKAKIASLKYEYSELKDKVSDLQMDLDSDCEAIRQIDEQIAELQVRRAELSHMIGDMNKEKDDLNYAQKMVANSIPKVVQEVQTAISKKSEWKSKKENALNSEAEILAKFATLKGFYL